MDDLINLRMGKLQLLDEEHLLIKYASEEVVTYRNGDPTNMPSLFVVYNMTTTEVRNFLFITFLGLPEKLTVYHLCLEF